MMEEGDKLNARLKKLEQEIRNLVEIQERLKEDEISDTIAEFDPPIFTGEDRDPIVLEKWIRSFDKLFETMKCPKNLMVKNAVFYLRGVADMWWAEREDSVINQPNFGWLEFKEELRAMFCPPYLKVEKVNEFVNLKQGEMTVEEYYWKFMELMCFFASEVVSTEELKVCYFEEGLNLGLRVKLGGERFDSLDKLYEKARYLDAIGSQFEEASSSGKHRKIDNQHDVEDNNGYRNELGQGKPKRIYYCKRCPYNHPGKNCDGTRVECNCCGKLGHREYECYAKKGKGGC